MRCRPWGSCTNTPSLEHVRVAGKERARVDAGGRDVVIERQEQTGFRSTLVCRRSRRRRWGPLPDANFAAILQGSRGDGLVVDGDVGVLGLESSRVRAKRVALRATIASREDDGPLTVAAQSCSASCATPDRAVTTRTRASTQLRSLGRDACRIGDLLHFRGGASSEISPTHESLPTLCPATSPGASVSRSLQTPEQSLPVEWRWGEVVALAESRTLGHHTSGSGSRRRPSGPELSTGGTMDAWCGFILVTSWAPTAAAGSRASRR